MLRTLEENDKDRWSEHVTELVTVYNSTLHATKGFSPCFLIHCHESMLPVDFMLGITEEKTTDDVDSWIESHLESLCNAHDIARQSSKGNFQERRIVR